MQWLRRIRWFRVLLVIGVGFGTYRLGHWYWFPTISSEYTTYLYVATWGRDDGEHWYSRGNTCTVSAQPCATVQYALDKIPKVTHNNFAIEIRNENNP